MGFLENQAKKMLGEGISQVAGQVLGGNLDLSNLGDFGDLGDLKRIIEMIISKLKENISIPQIAKDVEKPENFVQSIADVVSKAGVDADLDKILESVLKLSNLKK